MCSHPECNRTDVRQDIICQESRPTIPCQNGHPVGFWSMDLGATIALQRERSSDVIVQHDVAQTSSPVTSTPPERRRLGVDRRSVTRTFRLPHVRKDGSRHLLKLYFNVGMYDDGSPGEVFVRADRVGSLMRGALDATATFASLLLQHGVPLAQITSKLRHTRFEPSGFTGDPEFPSCSSPLDLLAQWLDRRFGKENP